MDIVSILILIVLIITALGTFFPQRSIVIDLDHSLLERWEKIIRERYSALTSLLVASGVFTLFRSPLFSLSLTILGISTLICTLDRWRTVWRRAFHIEVPCSDATFEIAPYSTVMNGITETHVTDVLKPCIEKRGFRVRIKQVNGTLHLRGDRNRIAHLGTLISHLGVVLLLMGALISGSFRWQEELSIKSSESISIQHLSGMAVINDGFIIERYPDGSASSYEANVILTHNGKEVIRGSVRPNKPLSSHDVNIYLQGYSGTEGNYNVTFLVVSDPGYGSVIASCFLLLLGLTMTFNFPCYSIHARLEPSARLRLAGRAERRAYDFEREYVALMDEFYTVAGAQ